MNDWKQNCLKLKSRFKALKKQFRNKNLNHISLPDKLNRHFNSQITDSAAAVPFYVKSQRSWRYRFKNIINPIEFAYQLFSKSPKAFASHIGRVDWVDYAHYVWKKMAIVKNITSVYYNFYYKRHSLYADFTKSYIYVPLQYQPELSTSPLADAYVDQQLIVQMISKYLPEDVYLYVKEHPMQTSCCRNTKFYKDLSQTKNVVLVRKEMDSFNLIKHSLAVATSTGTPGWEALFRGKPVLMFGSYIYQFADGVYKIRTTSNCQDALDQIIKRRVKPSLKSMKLYLKALGEVSFPAVIDPDYLPVSKLTEKENIANITQALLLEINHIKIRHGN
jgi:hypothetical protein